MCNDLADVRTQLELEEHGQAIPAIDDDGHLIPNEIVLQYAYLGAHVHLLKPPVETEHNLLELHAYGPSCQG